MTGREGPGPERPGPDYPPDWDTEPAERDGWNVSSNPNAPPPPWGDEDAPCGLCGLVPREGEQHRAVFAVGDTGEDAEEVCVGPDRRQLDYAPLPGTEPAPLVVTPDPWASPGPVPPPPF